MNEYRRPLRLLSLFSLCSIVSFTSSSRETRRAAAAFVQSIVHRRIAPVRFLSWTTPLARRDGGCGGDDNGLYKATLTDEKNLKRSTKTSFRPKYR